jgi:hypothetical protein
MSRLREVACQPPSSVALGRHKWPHRLCWYSATTLRYQCCSLFYSLLLQVKELRGQVEYYQEAHATVNREMEVSYLTKW